MEELSEGSEPEDKNILQEGEVFLRDEGAGTVRQRKRLSSRFTLSAASKMLRQKIPQSGLLMLPRRLWMQTVPTQDCEVVALFSASCSEATVNWLVDRLKSRIPELVIIVKSHLATGSFALYISATMNGLVKGGEDLHLCKKTKPEYGGGLREVSREELHMFQGVEDPSTFFTSQERQLIVFHILNSLRGVDGDEISDITFRLGQAIIPKLQTDGVILHILPLHEHKQLGKLRTSWVQSFFRYQPLDLIQEYFGPKIAIYFSWLGFYTASLTVPAFIGLVFWIKYWGRDQAQEDKAFVVIAFINVIWGSMWLEGWKRKSAELTHRWGIQEYPHELLQDLRPEFVGELQLSPVTGRMEPFYPSWKRNLFRYLVTLPVVLSCLGLVFGAMFVILQIQGWVDSVIERRGLPALISYVPKFIMAVMISVFDEGYSKIALWLNNMENYRQEETYQNHLIIKLTVFRLVNSFLVLFYIAFYLQDMESLKAQLAALFVTRQIVGNIKESCIPYFMEQMKLAKLSFDLYGALTPTTEDSKWNEEREKNITKSANNEEQKLEEADTEPPLNSEQHGVQKKEEIKNPKPDVPLSRLPSKNRIVSQAEIECNMAKYDGTFEDYLEMFIQFGYVMLFSSAFPLAATCAFVNNLVEIRSDAFKLCCVFHRPFGQRVRSIGVWQDAMELMCLLGIMVNCMLIGMSGQVHRMFPEMSTTQTILLIIFLEHAMIALKYGISYAIPDEPEWIIQEIAKTEFQRREALKKLSSSTSPPTLNGSEQTSPKSGPNSNMSSMEYIERSVQTEPHLEESRKLSLESKTHVEHLPDVIEGKVSDDKSKIKESTSSVNLSKTSTDVKAKGYIPGINRRWNQSYLDSCEQAKTSSSMSLGTVTSEPLPNLSAPANFDNKTRFNFAHPEHDSPHRKETIPPSPDKDSNCSSRSRSSDSMAGNILKEEMISSSAPKELILSKEMSLIEAENRRQSFPHQQEQPKRKKTFPSIESLQFASHSDFPTKKNIKRAESFRVSSIPEIPKFYIRSQVPAEIETKTPEVSRRETEPVAISRTTDIERRESGAEASSVDSKLEASKVAKKHPSKFLKRAQSFSQVFGNFKKPASDKKKKSMYSIQDDYNLTISREPLGELALVPLEKLVSIDTIQSRSTTINYSTCCYDAVNR